MASSTFAQARDDILGMVKTAWAAAPATYVMVWDDLKASIPTTLVPWARTTLRHNTSRQASLSGGLGTQKYIRTGTLTIQVFTLSGNGLQTADSLCKIFADAFEGKASPRGVWFRNVTFNEIGPDGHWYQTNVVIDFEYNEIK